jgi:predicted DNA-binding transcriptional regulator AlpA
MSTVVFDIAQRWVKRCTAWKPSETDVTHCNVSPMAIKVEGVTYLTAADIHRDLGISRQTLWRWRQSGKIPRGRRYRDRQVVFTEKEAEMIREYANRLEPTESVDVDQLKLFRSDLRKRGV